MVVWYLEQLECAAWHGGEGHVHGAAVCDANIELYMGVPIPFTGVVVAAAFAWSVWPGLFGFLRPTSSAQQRAVEIAKGVWMPLVANGISRNHSAWLRAGGRHVDTAFVYGDAQQAAVGEAIAASGLPRADLFVTTKVVCCPTHRCSEFCTEPPNAVNASMHNVSEQLEHSLRLLGLEYADLVLLHWPCARLEDTVAAYSVLEQAHAAGRARAIGVSNMNASALAALLKVVSVSPAVNQCAHSIAGHPAAHDGVGTRCLEGSRLYGADDETARFSQQQHVAFAAYSPLGSISNVDVLGRPEVQAVAQAKAKSPAQVALRWLVQQGVTAVTATSNPAHAAEALAVFDFSLTRREMKELGRLR